MQTWRGQGSSVVQEMRPLKDEPTNRNISFSLFIYLQIYWLSRAEVASYEPSMKERVQGLWAIKRVKLKSVKCDDRLWRSNPPKKKIRENKNTVSETA